MRLVSPMFNLTPEQYAQQRNSFAKYPVKGFPWAKWMTSVDVDLDGVVYGDGTFIGPDKTLVFQRYVMARFAARDEALATLNLINSSAASPLILTSQLGKCFLGQLHWKERTSQHTPIALYVRARGASALALDGVLRRRGLAGLKYVVQNFASHHSGADASPSSFDHVYKKLSDEDPQVFAPLSPSGP